MLAGFQEHVMLCFLLEVWNYVKAWECETVPRALEQSIKFCVRFISALDFHLHHTHFNQ